MSNKKLLILRFLLTIRRRKRCLLLLLTLVFIIITLITKLSQTSNHFKCNQLKAKALNEICLSYERHDFTGSLCDQLCRTKTLILKDCPNFDGHNGKDYVFIGHLYDHQNGHQSVDKIVLKARTLTTFELIGSNKWRKDFKHNKHFIVKAINQVMTERFANSLSDPMVTNQSTDNLFYVNKLLSEPIVTNLDQLNETTLINIWLLLQDNEFVLSKIYSHVFPPVVGTCGHFYGVKYADHILDISYFTPNYWPIMSRSLEDRVEIGLKIMQFLRQFVDLKPKLELCDIKFEHLALMAQQIILIDSDMIYTEKAVIDSIEWISRCDDNSDCDFIDCKGVCLNDNKCAIDGNDDDLMRVCRNIFFMGKLYGLIGLGLFDHQNNDHSIKERFQLIHNLCFERSDLQTDMTQIEDILMQIKMILIQTN